MTIEDSKIIELEHMLMKDYDMEGKHILMGNEAMAEGALAAGCRFFAGYPITPQNDVPQRMSMRLPQLGGRFLQAEDELASINAVVGASYAGMKAMTSTSGPGFSLMQEALSWAFCVECPIVVCDVQRTGPGSGIVSLPHQSDIIQAQYGGNGEYKTIAYSPATCQELFDFTFDAFNASEEYRVPAFVFSDSWLGHIHERVVIPPNAELKKKIRRRKVFTGKDSEYFPFTRKIKGEIVIPEVAPTLGYDSFPNWLPSVTHAPTGVASEDSTVSKKMVEAINDKITKNQDKICKIQELYLDDSDIAVVTYGFPSRPSLKAVRDARAEGIKVGLFRMQTVWPFPENAIQKLTEKVKKIIVVEINMGQMLVWVKSEVQDGTEVHFLPEISKLHEPKQIVNKINELV